MRIKADIDVRKFNAYTRELAKRLGVSVQHTQEHEAAAVMKRAASMEKVANKAATTSDALWSALSRIDDGTTLMTVNSGKRGGWPGQVWFTDHTTGRHGRKRWFPIAQIPSIAQRGRMSTRIFWNTDQRLPGAVWAGARATWAAEQNEAAQVVQMRLRSRGLTMASWVQIIDAVGVPLDRVPPSGKVPAWVRQATTRTGKPQPRMGYAVRYKRRGNFVLETNQASVIAIRRGAAAKIAGAIRIRAAAYRRAVKADAFRSARDAARLYPGLVRVRP